MIDATFIIGRIVHGVLSSDISLKEGIRFSAIMQERRRSYPFCRTQRMGKCLSQKRRTLLVLIQ